MTPTEQSPWKKPPLNEWRIVGMNHYGKDGQTWLFVAMTKRNICIRAEARDDDPYGRLSDVWDALRAEAILAELPNPFRLTFDPKATKDKDIKTIFADWQGGLMWCALRANRIVDQHFNANVAKMVKELRERGWERVYGSFPEHSVMVQSLLHVRSHLGNSERHIDWARALWRLIENQGVYRFEIEKAK